MSEPRSTVELRPSPSTDPTCCHTQAQFGWPGPNERAAERAQDEPGLTEEDRDARDPGQPPAVPVCVPDV